jgi:type IV secretion system coupling TraD/TrwB family protein
MRLSNPSPATRAALLERFKEARKVRVGDTLFIGDTREVAPMGDERKAKVFIANMSNRITFNAADEDSAKIAADTLGKRKSRRRTYGYSGGK